MSETCPRSVLTDRCGAALREDTVFAAEMAMYRLPQRRYLCVAGHSVYTGMPTLDAAKPIVVRPRAAPGRLPKVCPQCDEAFLGLRRQIYCDPICSRARAIERERGRRPDGRYGLTGEALRLARAIPSAWTRGTALRPYPRERRGQHAR